MPSKILFQLLKIPHLRPYKTGLTPLFRNTDLHGMLSGLQQISKSPAIKKFSCPLDRHYSICGVMSVADSKDLVLGILLLHPLVLLVILMPDRYLILEMKLMADLLGRRYFHVSRITCLDA